MCKTLMEDEAKGGLSAEEKRTLAKILAASLKLSAPDTDAPLLKIKDKRKSKVSFNIGLDRPCPASVQVHDFTCISLLGLSAASA